MIRRDAVKYIAGALGLAASSKLLAPQGYPAYETTPDHKSTVLPPPMSQAPVGRNIGTNTIIPKTVGNGIYFTPGALMTVNVWNSVSSQAVTFECWYIDPSGQLKQIPNNGSGALADMTGLTSARAVNTQKVTLPIEGGTIVSFAARISGGATKRGQTLVKAEIDNDANGGATISTTTVIVYGYAYTRKDLTYPAVDSVQDPVEGRGFIRNAGFPISTGTDTSAAVPTNARWKVLYVLVLIITSAGVANRKIALTISVGGANGWTSEPQATVTANQTVFAYFSQIYTTAAGAIDANSNEHGYMPPDVYLNAGDAIATNTIALQAGDQLSGNVIVEEWLDPSS